MTTVSSDAEADSSTRISQVFELEKQLKAQIKEKRAFHPDVRNARGKLREKYVEIILTEPELSEKYDTATSLWHLIYYVMIEEFRTRIRYAASTPGGKGGNQRVQKLLIEFRNFIAEATKFYSGLILKLKKKYGVLLDEGSEFDSLVLDSKRLTEFRKTCHRFFIHMGDLARYKELHSDNESYTPDWRLPAGYYFKAVSLWPATGHPHNQLAVVATYMRNDFLAVYHYFRSLGVEDPFITARGNLVLLFERNRQQYSEISEHKRRDKKGKEISAKSKPDSREAELEMKRTFFIRFVRLNGILFTKTSLETFSEVFLETVRDLDKLLSLDTPTLESLFSSELLKVEDATKGLAVGLLQLVTILIFSVPNGSSRSSYADVLQHATISKYALLAAFKIAGCFMSTCAKSNDVAESPLLPASLVFMEWLASRQDLAVGSSTDDEKQLLARAGFWRDSLALLNKICDTECSHETDEAALWEDHELAGFNPLVSVHLGLDFGKRPSSEARLRTNRFVAAGKSIAKMLEGNSTGLAFDEDMSRFYLAGEQRERKLETKVVLSKPQLSDAIKPVEQPPSKSLAANIQRSAVEAKVAESASSSVIIPPVEEEEEEVIVFQPVVKAPVTSSARESELYPKADVYGSIGGPAPGDLYSSVSSVAATLADFSKPSDVLVSPYGSLRQSDFYGSMGIADSSMINGSDFKSNVSYGVMGLPAAMELNKWFPQTPVMNGGQLQDMSLMPQVGTGMDTTGSFSSSYSSVAQDLLFRLKSLSAAKDQLERQSTDKVPFHHHSQLPVITNNNTAAEAVRDELAAAGRASVRPPPGFGPIPQRASSNQKLANNKDNNLSWTTDNSFQSGRAAGGGQPLFGGNLGIWSNTNNGIPKKSAAYPFPGMGVHTLQQIEQQLQPAEPPPPMQHPVPSFYGTWKPDSSAARHHSFEKSQLQQPPQHQPHRPPDPFVS